MRWDGEGCGDRKGRRGRGVRAAGGGCHRGLCLCILYYTLRRRLFRQSIDLLLDRQPLRIELGLVGLVVLLRMGNAREMEWGRASEDAMRRARRLASLESLDDLP